jgi:glycolate oxidase
MGTNHLAIREVHGSRFSRTDRTTSIWPQHSADRMRSLVSLMRELPAGVLLTGAHDLDAYVAPGMTGHPLAVVRARHTADVQAALRWAHSTGTRVLVRGGGSRIAPQGRCADGALVVSTERMVDITIDTSAKTAVAMAGARVRDLDLVAAELDLTYPLDPAAARATIGGDVATDAHRLSLLRSGTTFSRVVELQVVLADGSSVRISPTPDHLQRVRLFAGSHGALGVITEVTVRLDPAPRTRGCVVALFADREHAARAAVDTVAMTAPRSITLVSSAAPSPSRSSVMAANSSGPQAVLVIDYAADDSNVTAEMLRADAHCRAAGGQIAESGASASVQHETVAPTGATLGIDLSVPVSRVPDLLHDLGDIERRFGVSLAVRALPGEGWVHATVAESASPPDSASLALAALEVAASALSEATTYLPSTHWIGCAESGAVTHDIASMRRQAKAALDPRGILSAQL